MTRSQAGVGAVAVSLALCNQTPTPLRSHGPILRKGSPHGRGLVYAFRLVGVAMPTGAYGMPMALCCQYAGSANRFRAGDPSATNAISPWSLADQREIRCSRSPPTM